VYLSRDKRMDLNVAIKALPSAGRSRPPRPGPAAPHCASDPSPEIEIPIRRGHSLGSGQADQVLTEAGPDGGIDPKRRGPSQQDALHL
jgi:hypothetical protein